MAVPNFLSSSFRYLLSAGVTDVNTIIANFESETVTNGNPVWTKPSAGLYQSPVNAQGRWFDVLLTRIDATTLEMRLRNWQGTTITTRRCYIDAGGSNVRIFSGRNHFDIICERPTPEAVGGGMLDLTPEAQDSHLDTIYGYGYRTAAGAVDGAGANWPWMANLASGITPTLLGQVPATADGVRSLLKTNAGTYLWIPCVLAKYGGVVCGTAYQRLVCSVELAAGSEVDVPIDVGMTGTFIVTAIGATTYTRLAIRKA